MPGADLLIYDEVASLVVFPKRTISKLVLSFSKRTAAALFNALPRHWFDPIQIKPRSYFSENKRSSLHLIGSIDLCSLDKESVSNHPFPYDFRPETSVSPSKEDGVPSGDDITNIYIKVESHDHFAVDNSKENFPDFSQPDQKALRKQENELPADSHWESHHIPTTQSSSNLVHAHQLLPGTHLHVQSQMSPTIQTPIKSGTPNSLNPYKVLPPVTPTGINSASHVTQEDFLLPPGSAMSTFSGLSGLSPFQGFSPVGSSFVSPRHSAKSNSRNLFSAARKRTLSVSPLSMDGIDLNALIRVSPSSLFYSGSLNTSPLPPISNNIMDHTSGYGHLNARNALTPSNGTLSRQLLAATPGSMILQIDHSAPGSQDFMAGAYANVIEHQHKHYPENHYPMETFFAPSSNLTVQHPETSFQRMQQSKKENFKHSDGTVESSTSNKPKIKGSYADDRTLRLSENSGHQHPPSSLYSVNTNRNKAANSFDVANRQEHFQLSGSKTDNVNSGNTTATQSGAPKTWICQWIDCNLIFQVSVTPFM